MLATKFVTWTKIEVMEGPETNGQFQFTGVKKKYFNSYTPTGKMNCVLATYSDIALLVLYFKVRKTKQQTIAKIPNQKPLNQPTKQTTLQL